MAFALNAQSGAVEMFREQFAAMAATMIKDSNGKGPSSSSHDTTTTLSRYVIIIYDDNPVAFGLLLRQAIFWVKLNGGPSRTHTIMKMLKDDILSCLSLLKFTHSFAEGQAKFVAIITETLQLAGDDEEATGIEDAVACRIKQTGDFHKQWSLVKMHLTATSRLAGLGMKLAESSIYELACTAFRYDDGRAGAQADSQETRAVCSGRQNLQPQV